MGKGRAQSDAVSYLVHPPASSLPVPQHPKPCRRYSRSSSSSSSSSLSSEAPPSRDDRHCCKVFAGHHNSVTRLLLHRRRCLVSDCSDSQEQDLTTELTTSLFSGSRDGTIREWLVDARLNTARIRRLYVGHSDWVNDVANVPHQDGIVVLSASNDQTLRVFQSPNTFYRHPEIVTPTATLVHHTDYVTCVAAAKASSLAATGSADQRIALWDLQQLVPTLTLERGDGLSSCSILSNGGPKFTERNQSIRSLQLSDTGFYLSCSSGRDISVWDTRTNGPVVDLRDAHSDIIRRFDLSSDGKHGISTAADGSVFLWDFRHLPTGPYKAIHLHSDSVWALNVQDEDRRVFFTGDRQGLILGFKLNDLYSVDQNPGCFWMGSAKQRVKNVPNQLEWTFNSVFDLAYDSESQQLWVATGDSAIARWDLNVAGSNPVLAVKDGDTISTSSSSSEPGSPSSPSCVIPGFHKLRQVQLLQDQKTAITQSLLFDVQKWDIVRGSLIDSYGKADFNEIVDAENPFQSVLPWCSLDIALGCIRVTLKEHTAFAAEVVSPDNPEVSVTYASEVLDRIFWLYGNTTLRRPKNMHEACTLVSIQVDTTRSAHQDARWTCLSCALSNTEQFPIPLWAQRWVVERTIADDGHRTKDIKVFLVPVFKSEVEGLVRNHVQCKSWTPISSIVAYIKNLIKANFSTASFEGPSLILTCMDQELDLHMDIGTVRDLIWKKNQVKGKTRPFEIYYSVSKPEKRISSQTTSPRI